MFLRRKTVAVIGLTAIGIAGLAAWPVTTRQAVDYRVHEITLPLGVKVSEFLLRDYWYRRLAKEIAPAGQPVEERLAKILAWTQANIRPIPPGWPVMDDHIYYTLIRGYGVDEQRADVFTTLSSYAGIPAFWAVVKTEAESPERLILSFAKIEGRWTVWDVDRGISFRMEDGSLASVSDLSAHPEWSRPSGGEIQHQGRPYADFLRLGLPHFFVPPTLRPEKQMRWPRLRFEARRLWAKIRSAGCYNSQDLDPNVVFTPSSRGK